MSDEGENQIKLTGVLDVKAFGAKGDGTTDGTAATSVVLGRHNFTAGKISSSGQISTITTSSVV